MSEKKNYSTEQITSFCHKHPSVLFVLGYIGLLVINFIFEKNGRIGDTALVESLMQFCLLLATGIFIIYMMREQKKLKKEEALLVFIMCVGIIMRVGYTMYTPWYLRGHDLGNLSTDPDSTGHCAYILHLFQGKLPSTNEYQFYHPPFYHFLAALSMHISGLLSGKTNGAELIEAAKLVSCMASIGVLYQVKEMLKENHLLGRAGNIVMLIVACMPNYYLMAGRINNDSLVFFFMVLIVRYTIKWYRNPDYKNTIILALGFGFGIMTKVSCGVMAVFTGIVMLIKFYQTIKAHTYISMLKKFVLFGCISGILGLWYPIRNSILFHQPLNYVAEISTSNPVYCGDHSLAERFSLLYEFTGTRELYNHPIDDYNLLGYLLRSAVFGEFEFSITAWVAKGVFIINNILALAALIAIIYCLVAIKNHRKLLYGLGFIWLLQVSSFIWFNFGYPFACTMDYRYIPLTTVIGGIFLGICFRHLRQKSGMGYRLLCKGMQAMVLLYAVLSVVMYTNIQS